MKFKTRYRIATDEYLGYECQIKYWFWPFWFQLDGVNTHETIAEAEAYIEWVKNGRKL